MIIYLKFVGYCLRRRIISQILFTIFITNVYGQKEDMSYKRIVDKFEHLYNKSNYDSIFYMFSFEMKKDLPLGKTIIFLTDIKKQAGKILLRKFENYESSYASYKAEGERRLLSLNISLDKSLKINGLFIEPYTQNDLPEPERNSTKLILPFNELWTVMWGGDTKELNYHIEVAVQKNAFDFIITDSSGKSYKTNSKTNEDYYAFGKDIIAACAGEVVLVVDGVKDNMPGQVNPMFVTGNTVIIKTENNEYILYAHFKKHSIVVKEKQIVRQGQLLGHCGNSGNSSEPHLHFHMQNTEGINIATGIKCYFESIHVNGNARKDHSPIKGEFIQNVKQ